MRHVCLAILLAFATALTSLAQDDDDSGIKSRIIALENLSKVQAWKTKDIKTLDKLLDSDFVSVNVDGKLQNKSELLSSIQSADILDYTATAIVVRTHRDTAIATGLYQIRGIVHGKPFVSHGRFVDSWLLKNRQWVAIASLMTPIG